MSSASPRFLQRPSYLFSDSVLTSRPFISHTVRSRWFKDTGFGVFPRGPALRPRHTNNTRFVLLDLAASACDSFTRHVVQASLRIYIRTSTSPSAPHSRRSGTRGLIAKHEQQLADMVKADGKVLGRDFAVVDVRGEDYAGGHIKGAIHQSSKTLPHGGVEAIREKTKNVPTVIFHCLLSQVRFVFLELSVCLTLTPTVRNQGPRVCQGTLVVSPVRESVLWYLPC